MSSAYEILDKRESGRLPCSMSHLGDHEVVQVPF